MAIAILPRLLFTAKSKQIIGHAFLTSKIETARELPSHIINSPLSENRLDQGEATRVGDAGIDLSNAPDGSDAFISELAGIMASYAEQIAAAQISYPASIARGAIRRLIGERAVAVRNLMERWIAQQRKKQAQRPNQPPPEPSPPPKPGS